MPTSRIITILVGLATTRLVPLPANAQQPRDTIPKDTAPSTIKTEVPPEEPPSAKEALQAAIEAAERLESAEPDTIVDLVKEINTYTAIVHAEDPFNPWLDYVAGFAYAASGRKGDAIDRLELFTRTREGRNHWRAQRFLGDLLVASYPRLAKASYVKAGRLKRNEPTVLFGLSRCAESAGDLDAAIDLAEQVVRADRGKTLRYVHYLTGLFASGGRWADAQRSAQQAVALAEREISTDGNLSVKLQQLDGEIGTSLEVLAGVIREHPDGEDAYLLIARLLRQRAENARRLSRLDELRILELAVEEVGDRSSVRLLEARAAALAEVGRTEDAIEAFEALLLKDPANLAATDWLARLRRD